MFSVIESEFAFFEVQVKCIFSPAMKFLQAMIGVAPETFDAIDVSFTSGKFVGPMNRGNLGCCQIQTKQFQKLPKLIA